MSNMREFTEYTPEMADAERKAVNNAKKNFKFPEGKTQFRVFPGLRGKSPFMITQRHWVSVSADQRRPLTCMGAGCPLCQRSSEASRAGDDVTSKEFAARSTYACLIVDRANEEAGPQVAELSWSVYDRLNGFVEQYGDFSSATEGYDIIVKRVGTGKMDTKYTTDPILKPKRKLAKDDAQLEEWLATLPSLEDSAPLGTPEMIRKLTGAGHTRDPGRLPAKRSVSDDV
jgi:hypothetical protein